VPAPFRYIMPAYRLRHAGPVVMHCLQCGLQQAERRARHVDVEVEVRVRTDKANFLANH